MEEKDEDGMITYSTMVMELLSLGRTLDGVCRIQVAVVREDKRAAFAIDIDEYTYLELEALRPLNGGRVRLSLYPKRDPYRDSYYSAIVRMSGVSRGTLYFACSESFAEEIKRIRESWPPPAGEREPVLDDSGKAIARRRAKPVSGRSLRLPRMAKLLLFLYGLLVVLPIPSEGGSTVSLPALNGKVDAAAAALPDRLDTAALSDRPDAAILLNRPDAAVAALSATNARQREVSHTAADATAEHTDTAPVQVRLAAPQADYAVMEIDGEKKKIFGLPKTYVALTFDDGPSPLTEKIVDILTKQKVAATFLFIGKNAERHPEGVAYAYAHGMSVGNHSWDHSVLTKANPKEQSKNLSKTSALLESLTHASVTLFRPPYGAVDDELVAAAGKLDMKTLLWNRDPEDWNAKKPADIVRYFHQVEASGGVYVMHEDRQTVEALPDIIQYLKEKQLTFVIFK